MLRTFAGSAHIRNSNYSPERGHRHDIQSGRGFPERKSGHNGQFPILSAIRGLEQIRTAVEAFAELSLATRPRDPFAHSSPRRPWPLGSPFLSSCKVFF